MVFTDIYLSLVWHTIFSIIVALTLVWIFEKWWVIIIAIAYFFFAPYGHEEEIRNCQTVNGYTVSIIVKFKEPILKFLWTNPTDVQVTAINGLQHKIKLSKSLSKRVYDATVFEGGFSEKGKSNTLLLIL